MQRLKLEEVYIPNERVGLYQNSTDALYFANGKIIQDVEPESLGEQEFKDYELKLAQKVDKLEELFLAARV